MKKQYVVKATILKVDSGYDGNTSIILEDPKDPVDVHKIWEEDRGESAEKVDELIESGYPNWDSQDVQIPESIVAQIKADAVKEYLSEQSKKAADGTEPEIHVIVDEGSLIEEVYVSPCLASAKVTVVGLDVEDSESLEEAWAEHAELMRRSGAGELSIINP